MPSVTEEALDCSWKRRRQGRKAGLPGSCWLLLLLSLCLLFFFLFSSLSAFDLLVDSIAQKGPDLGHEGTATASACNANDSRVPGTQAPGPNPNGKQRVKCTFYFQLEEQRPRGTDSCKGTPSPPSQLAISNPRDENDKNKSAFSSRSCDTLCY